MAQRIHLIVVLIRSLIQLFDSNYLNMKIKETRIQNSQIGNQMGILLDDVPLGKAA